MEHNLVNVGLSDEEALLEILKERDRNGESFVSFFFFFVSLLMFRLMPRRHRVILIQQCKWPF